VTPAPLTPTLPPSLGEGGLDSPSPDLGRGQGGGAKRVVFLGLILLFSSILSADDLQFETKIPLGLAHDGTILWIADAQTRELTGYDVAQKKKLASRALSFDVRDIAYWAPNLVTVGPNYVYVINPLNGDLVDKIQLKGIADPVAIALDVHQAYIYNREDKKIYRVHLVDRLQFGSFTPEVSSDIRSMTFYKGFLWAIAKDGKAYKISPTDGQQVSFLPLPESCYGIAFVDGGMYVARPGQVRSIDFIETENYVAAARRNFTIAGVIDLIFPWSDEDRERESKMQLRYSLLPVTAHQRIAGLRADPATRFGRQEDGAHSSEILLDQKSGERKRTHKLQFQATLFNLTHIFNGSLLKQYFRSPELPDSVRPFLDNLNLAPAEQAQLESFRKSWLAQNDGKHPIYAIAAAQKDAALKNDVRCAIYRSLGTPCRRMRFFDLDAKKASDFLQVYIQPTGWVTVTQKYDPTKPKEFPVANNELELYSPDAMNLNPRPRVGKAGLPVVPVDLLQFRNVQIITSSAE
jgi:hypothetical protein